MNILVVSNYSDLTQCAAIFIEEQIKAYRKIGHNVRILIPISFGKKDYCNNVILPIVNKVNINDVIHVYFRYISCSKYGNYGLNARGAMLILKTCLSMIMDDFIPDIIHANQIGDGSIIGKELKKIYKCPLVVTVHGGDINGALKNGLANKVRDWSNEADALVTVSSLLKNKVISTGSMADVKVILNGYKTDFSTIKTEYIKYPITVLQVGSLIKQKKVNVTIAAFARLRKKYDAHLYIVGTGEEEKALKELCTKYNITKYVTFTGQLTNSEVLNLMKIADFFVMPSVDEGFGIVYLEAMSQSCLTIGTLGEGIEDFIKSGKNGFLVPPNDDKAIFSVLEYCVNHPRITQKIIEEGGKDAKTQTWEKNVKEYTALFNSLL